MRLLVNGAVKDMEAIRSHPRASELLGVMVTPSNRHSGSERSVARVDRLGLPVACDNSALSGFHAPSFLHMVRNLAPLGLMWVAAPDSVQWVGDRPVGDACKTLELFREWCPILRGFGVPVALVTQDDAHRYPILWDDIDAIFVGGSDTWKFSAPSADICAEAKRRGKLVHVGRVNSRDRMRQAAAIGADTVDGSQFSWWPRKYLPKALRWLGEVNAEAKQLTLY